jgi:hypothetical protein
MESSAQFIQERVYRKGVNPKSVLSRQCAFKAFAGVTETKTATIRRIAAFRAGYQKLPAAIRTLGYLTELLLLAAAGKEKRNGQSRRYRLQTVFFHGI